MNNDMLEIFTKIMLNNPKEELALQVMELTADKMDLQQQIDKAIEYIENNISEDNNSCGCWWYSLPYYTTPNELLSILKGENNEEDIN